MRLTLSALYGAVLATLCVLVLAVLTTLGTLQLVGCGVAIAALATNHAYDLRSLRRLVIRLRVFRRRLLEEAAEHPTRDGSVAARTLVLFRLVTGRVKRGVRGFGTRMAAVASRSFQSAVGLLRSLSRALGAGAALARRLTGFAQRGAGADRHEGAGPAAAGARPQPELAAPPRARLMWVSYALLVAWAGYETIAVSRFAREPIEMAAAGAASAIDAMATTSAAIRTIGAAAASDDTARHLPLPAAAAMAAAMSEREQTDRARPSATRGDSNCSSVSILDLFLNEKPVKEL